MKVVLYMAMTANGIIAKEDDDTSFVSKAEWKSFRAMIRRTGNMVIGRRTYEIMRKADEFAGLDKVKIVVVTHDISLKGDTTNIIFTSKQPKEVLRLLKKEGFSKVLIAGGSALNASFMKENLVDEVYLDVEPAVFGKGIRLFAEADFEAKLRLLEIRKLSKNVIHLHYAVVKTVRKT
ncbi:MAG: dihydrofolate reductase [Candidatus Aenigmarchaeota archaeon]|nr:dihydrofolate reductase [Candidatus Aenigmarchaeota archaeon]